MNITAAGCTIASLTITEADISRILPQAQETAEWDSFLDFLSQRLSDVLLENVRREVEYLYDLYQTCPHHRTQTCTRGGYHFSPSTGEIWDDIREITVCRDCGRVVD